MWNVSYLGEDEDVGGTATSVPARIGWSEARHPLSDAVHGAKKNTAETDVLLGDFWGGLSGSCTLGIVFCNASVRRCIATLWVELGKIASYTSHICNDTALASAFVLISQDPHGVEVGLNCFGVGEDLSRSVDSKRHAHGGVDCWKRSTSCKLSQPGGGKDKFRGHWKNERIDQMNDYESLQK